MTYSTTTHIKSGATPLKKGETSSVNQMNKPTLSKQQITAFKAMAHSLNPVVMIGQKGLTDAVIQETHAALQSHELIKIRIFSDDREERMEIANELVHALDAHLVQHIGKLLVLYRQRIEE